MKACQNGAHGDVRLRGVFVKGIQLAGVVCLASRSLSNTDPITLIASRTIPYQPATSTCLCARSWPCAGIKNVQSQSLVVKCGFISSEKNHSRSFTSGAQARHERASERGFLSYPARRFPFYNLPRFFLNLSNSI